MTRTLLAVLVAACFAAPGCRKPPPAPPTVLSVVRVYAVKGTAYFRRGDAGMTDATPGVSLERKDRISVGPASTLLLEVLVNRQLVRLDEDVDITVSELALLDAPQAGSNFEQQLEVLLATEERSTLSNRTAGWVVAQEAARAPVAREQVSVEENLLPSPSTAIPSTRPPDPEDLKAETRPGEAESDGAGGGGKRLNVEQVVKGTSPKVVSSNEGLAPPEDAELQRCIETLFERYGSRVKARYAGRLVLQYRLKDGTLRARMPDGLPLPACASDWLKEHQARLAPQELTWKDLPVPLK